MTTIPEDDFGNSTGDLVGLRFRFYPPDGTPGSDSNRPFQMDAVMLDQSGEDAPWRGDPQYFVDLLDEAGAAMAAKVATDYPLADPAIYNFQVTKVKGF